MHFLILLIVSTIFGCIAGSYTISLIGWIVGIGFFITGLPLAAEMSFISSQFDKVARSNEISSRRIEDAIRESSSDESLYDIKNYDYRQIHFHNKRGNTKVPSKRNSTLTKKNLTVKGFTK